MRGQTAVIAVECVVDDEIVAAVLDVAPTLRPWDVFARWHRSPLQGDTLRRRVRADQRRQRWQQRVLDEYLAETEHVEEAAETPLEHAHLSWALARPQAVVRCEGHVGAVLASPDLDEGPWGARGSVVVAWGEGSDALLPPHNAVRAYWVLEVSGLAFCDVATVIPRRGRPPELKWVRILPDRAVQQGVLERVTQWRQRHGLDAEPPQIDSSRACADFLLRRFPGPNRVTERSLRPASAEEVDLVLQLRAAKDRERAAHEDVRRLRNSLAARIGDDYGLAVPTTQDERARVLWVPVKGREDLDRERLRRKYPEVWEDCKRVGEPSRHLRLYGV